MNKLSPVLQPVSLFCLLAVAHQSHGQMPAPARLVAATTTTLATGTGIRALPGATDPTAKAPRTPLATLPNPTPGWVSLAGSLPADAPLTAEVLGTGANPAASRTWRGLTAGRVQLELNLRSVPAGSYVLRLSQDGRQWSLPLAVN